MAKKSEQKGKQELTVWASPAWSLKRIGQEVKLISACGFFPDERKDLVELKITVEEK